MFLRTKIKQLKVSEEPHAKVKRLEVKVAYHTDFIELDGNKLVCQATTL